LGQSLIFEYFRAIDFLFNTIMTYQLSRFVPLFGLLLATVLGNAQTGSYFQQEVNYKIAATLDDQQNTLTGQVEFEYVNYSSDRLTEIWVHLWGNAFKNRRSAFCKQKLRTGSTQFYFAPEQTLGYYKNLDFTADGQKAAWKLDPKNPDIALLTLPQPLAPGARVRIATPFILKIPASFSRLGHVGTSYQMTQWYPKPAVYDNRGWHAMPYLDQGEFYSEFGSFDVTLTLPDNYVVGATGVLQTPSEVAFLEKKEAESRMRLFQNSDSSVQLVGKEKSKKTDPFPLSSSTLKTIRYTAERVHDFAWFADKRFFVLRDTARLASGKTVDCWAMFTNSDSALWQKGAFYVRRAVEFYSGKVGEYPWPQATAVHSALSAGGGMEYPMITVIGNSSTGKELDDVITHEVGHNWFYGILASNERDHPFMDEGLNSYYEERYMQQYYGNYDPFTLPKWMFNPERSGSLLENGYLLLARDRKDTPPDSHSDNFAPIAYGLQVYMKTALCLRWLEKSLGTERFDRAMQTYYREWQFRHPYPEDLRAAWKKAGLTEQEIAWWFDAIQTQKQADFKLTGAEAADNEEREAGNLKPEKGRWEIEVKNKGDLAAPFSVTALKNGQPVATQWYTQPGELTFPPVEADQFVIDYEGIELDLNRKNNARRTSGLFPGFRPLEVKPLTIFQNTSRNTLTLLPWVGWNNADKTMLGTAIYNAPMPSRRLQYYLLPGYGLGSRSFVGLADVRYKIYPGGLFPKITVGVSAKTFNYDYNYLHEYYSKFWRVVPQVRAELRSGSRSFSHALNFRTLFIGREEGVFETGGVFAGKQWKRNAIYELRYEGEERSLPNPYRFRVMLESQPDYLDGFDRPANYLRGSVEWKQKFYYKVGRKITARMFAGYFLQSTQRNRPVEETAFALNPQGFNDYKFDQVFLARTGGTGALGRQVSQTEGGFKGAFGAAFAGQTGNSNNYIWALNLKADLPQKLPLDIPLRPYFDIGYFDDATLLNQNQPRSLNTKLLWSGGVLFEFFSGGLEAYFPLANSRELKRLYCEQSGGTNKSAIFCGGNYLKMISWSLRLNLTDPVDMITNIIR